MRNKQVIKHLLNSSYSPKQVDYIMDELTERTEGKPNFMIDFSMTANDRHRLRLNIIPTVTHGPTQLLIPPARQRKYKRKHNSNE